MRIFGLGCKGTSFDGLSDEQIETHEKIRKYGDFVLAGGISPSYNLKIMPRTGFRHDFYSSPHGDMPVIMISLSREILFDVFIDLIDLAGDMVDVVLETSHDSEDNSHRDLFKRDMELIILKSMLYDFEDVLLDDGYTGIVVLDREGSREVQFEENKLIIVYYRTEKIKKRALRILSAHHILEIPGIKFISEAEHIHTTSDNLIEQFEKLKERLGVEVE